MSELLSNAKSTNCFHWQHQPSSIDWKNGKSERQVLLDATRVNSTSFVTKSDPAKTARISKASI